MKKVLAFALMMVFIASMAIAQNPPKKAGTSVAKTEMKPDTTKKVAHHKMEPKKAAKKKSFK